MVHGGGHHHHSSGGSGSGQVGGSSGGSGCGSGSGPPPTRYHHHRGGSRFSSGGSGFSYISEDGEYHRHYNNYLRIFNKNRSVQDHNNNNQQTQDPHDGGDRGDCESCFALCTVCCCCFACVGARSFMWLVASILLWCVLFALASSNPTMLEDSMTFNVGETWQVKLPPLWSRRSIRIQSTSTDPGLEVYSFSPIMAGEVADCPLTNGPVKTMRNSQTILMEGEEYQYDYFHLNEGSIISLDTLQKKGATNIYILKGISALKTLEEDDAEGAYSFQNFRGRSILKRFSGNGGKSTITYEVTESDFYVIAYDNASTYTTTNVLQVELTITIATHSLESHDPICTAADTVKGCVWTFQNPSDQKRVARSCIIIKAVSSAVAEDVSEIEMNSNQVVTMNLDGTIGSPEVLWIASIPIIFGVLLLFQKYGTSCLKSKSDTTADEKDGLSDETTALKPDAMNPEYHAVGSAPPEAQAILVNGGYSAYLDAPIVTGEVIPLSPPANGTKTNSLEPATTF